MMNITINDSDKFEETIEVFKNTIIEIQDIFDKQNNNMLKIDDTEVWNSDTERVITSKYNELKNDYPNIIESLNNYVSFMNNTVESYKKIEKDIDSSVDKNLDNLNVN